MVLAEYCAPHFETHVPKLTRGLRAKLDTLMEALNEQFGTSAEFEDPKGGIFLWVKLPDNVDTLKLYQAALAAGVAINPGPEWSTDKAYAGSRLRLCFASPSHEQIREGVAVLAEVCRREFGVPERSANVEKRARGRGVKTFIGNCTDQEISMNGRSLTRKTAAALTGLMLSAFVAQAAEVKVFTSVALTDALKRACADLRAEDGQQADNQL